MRYIAQAYKALGDLVEAKSWLYRAIAEAPHTREPYFAMVVLSYEQKDWPTVYHMVEEALQITSPTGSYLDEPECWGYLFDDYGAISAYFLGMGDKAKIFARRALSFSPEDPRLQNNLDLCLKQFDS